MALINSTIERREMRLRSVERSIGVHERGLRIASKIEHGQAFRRTLAMLIGMPTAVAGLLFTGIFYAGWQGYGLWYGVACMLVSAATLSIRPPMVDPSLAMVMNISPGWPSSNRPMVR